jgi:succinate dehydrogenase / fumarate reductase cytochrome b subunit
MSSAPKTRPKYFEFNLAHHWPPAILSIFHRISGLLLFFPILPLSLYFLQTALGSEDGHARLAGFFGQPFVKLAMIGATWLYAHHFWAGIRYLLLDLHWGVAKAPARASAIVAMALGVLTAAIIGWRLW